MFLDQETAVMAQECGREGVALHPGRIHTRRAGGKIGRSPRALVFAPPDFFPYPRLSGIFVSLKSRWEN